MGSSSGSDSGGGGGRTDAQSQYGGTTGYDSSANQSGREQSFGGDNDGGGFDYEGEAYGTTTPTTPTTPTTSAVTLDEPLDVEDFREIPTQKAPEIFEPQPVVYDDVISPTTIDPGFVRALDEQATRQADPVYGDPDPYIDTPIEERDTITSFLDNYAANVKSNPFELGLIGALKNMYQTSKATEMMRGTPGYEFLDRSSTGDPTTPTGGGGDRDTITTAQPTTTTPTTTLPPSMVNQYFSNMGGMGNGLSSDLQTDYNNAKNSINSILGITPPSQQFGYSADPYGGLMANNLTTNPYNIDYLKRLGLI